MQVIAYILKKKKINARRKVKDILKDHIAEGVSTTEVAMNFLHQCSSDLPIFNVIDKALKEEVVANQMHSLKIK